MQAEDQTRDQKYTNITSYLLGQQSPTVSPQTIGDSWEKLSCRFFLIFMNIQNKKNIRLTKLKNSLNFFSATFISKISPK